MSKRVLTEEGRKARNEYIKQWRKDNPEKFKATQDRYWNKKAQKLAEQKGAEA